MNNEYYATLGAIQALIYRLNTSDRQSLPAAGQAKIDAVISQLTHAHDRLLQGGEALAIACREFRRVLDAAAQALQHSAFSLNEGFETLVGLDEQVAAAQSAFHRMAEADLPHIPIFTPLTNPTEPPPSSSSD